ncbi:MAG: NAD(P)H-hydrate dehydratase [Acidobacteriota bacterium]|jgi:NAD(P)H-hydrate epimerase|nr:NAD(P)H-hydrate dehydratase [Acidobacteriota bacterium]
MQKILTAEEMREVDRLTTEKYGIPSILLMENAAHATANIIKEKLGGSVEGKSFLILCGKGNNGGDGAALARILWTAGASIQIILFGKVEDTKGDSRINFEIAHKHEQIGEAFPGSKKGLKYFYFYEVETFDEFRDLTKNFKEDVCIDALFGTGLSRKVEGELEKVIGNLHHWQPRGRDSFIISLDLPSGINANSAFRYSLDAAGTEVKDHRFTAAQPDLTITFTAPKLANVMFPAYQASKELAVVNIGSPESLIDETASKLYLIEKKDAWYWVENTKFSSDSYKNKRGNALLIVGSKNYTGAAVLVGNAAMVSGIGLVTVATSESAQESVSARVLPEVITQSLAETKDGAISEKAFTKIKKMSEKADVLAIGSGLSSDEETTRKLVREVVEKRTTPIIIDADGLNSLSPFDLEGLDELPLILTPHEGEFLRLLGIADKEAIKDRVQAVRDFAEKYKVILVLKGERTLIGEPSGKVVINPTGNSGLGKAGNGDNLTGIITGFIAQTLATEHIKNAIEYETAKTVEKVFEAVVAAVYISGLAGDIAEKKFGKRTMLATDVRECLSDAFKELTYSEK